MITGSELTKQIKTVFGMKDGRSKNSKADWSIITRNLLYYVKEKAVDFRAYEMMLGIQWAFSTGRLNTDVDWTIRYMNALQYVELIGKVSDNCPTQNDIPRWLNTNLETI